MSKSRTLLALLVALLGYGAADRGTAPAPPVAAVQPTRLETAGQVRVDPYYWLAKRDDPAVIGYLEAENAYADAVMEPLDPLESEIYAEIKGRIQKDDSTVPVRRGDYFYYARFEGDGEYPLFARKRGSVDAREELLLDANELARGHSYFSVSGVEESSNEKLLAFATDTVGRRLYTLRFKDLESGRMLRDEIPGVTGNHAWAEDGRTIFYSKLEPGTLRWHRIYRHVVGADPSQDALVYEETDPEFECSVSKTRSRRFLVIESEQTLSNEVRYLDAKQPKGEFRVLLAREPDHEYSVDHLGDYFFIRTNWNAPNFRLMRAPVGQHRQGELAGDRSGPRGRLPRGLHAVSRPSRVRGAPRRPDPSPRPSVARRRAGRGRYRRARDRVRRAGLYRGHRRQPRGGRQVAALLLQLDDDPRVGLRLRPRDARAGAAQARHHPRRIRFQPLRDRAPVGHRARRRARADLAGVPQGPAASRAATRCSSTATARTASRATPGSIPTA